MNQYWILDEAGETYALVTGAAVRDDYLRQGWKTTDEPAEGFVQIWHDGIEQPGRVPIGTLHNLWAHRGWVAGPPQGGVHPFTPEAPAEPAETKPTKNASDGAAKKDGEKP